MSGATVETADAEAVEKLLDFLVDQRGLDFRGYKRPSLTRRIVKRMRSVGIPTFEEYQDFLEVHPDEHDQLVDTILINVTGFLRDPDAWDHLAGEVVPKIVAAATGDEPIRIWSAGCATGEEPYTLAMVLADHLGLDGFKKRVKIFATDTDESALVEARAGVYRHDRLDPMGSDRIERFFEPTDRGMRFRSDFRRSVIFGRHDITTDPPISRIDLVVCRNVLMYLTRDAQRQALGRYHYALRDGGFLFLGNAETIYAHEDLFMGSSSAHRIYTRVPGRVAGHKSLSTEILADIDTESNWHQLKKLAAAALPVAHLLIDINGKLVDTNSKARAMFGLAADDAGRSFHDLAIATGPVDLRARIEQAYVENRPIVVRNIERTLADGQVQFLEATVAPLSHAAGTAHGVSVTFADVTELGQMRADLERSALSLEVANEELQSVNEELAASNEELQSVNEELEASNEELQSANEELETLNEESQSANEELGTMNEELLDQADFIEQSSTFLPALLDSLAVGIVVVDGNFDVILANRAMEQIFGLRSEDVAGRSLLALDIGVPLADIGRMLHAAASGSGGTTRQIVDAVDQTGRSQRCHVAVETLAMGSALSADKAESRFVVRVDPLPGVAL